MNKPFASSSDLTTKKEVLELVAPGVFALTAQGDPNVGAFEGEDFLVCIEARATPAAAHDWLRRLRERSTKPVRHLVLTHYHAVRTLGAAAFEADDIIASEATAVLIEERGQADWHSELGRMPRLFKNAEGISGLTRPTLTFAEHSRIDLGGGRGHLDLVFCGRGHTAGDIVVWHEASGTLFAGDLVEAEAALYTGDAFHFDWRGATLDRVAAFGARQLVGGRGAVVRGEQEVTRALAQTREFLDGLIDTVSSVHVGGGDERAAFRRAHAALAPKFGGWPIFEHCLPFDVQRVWDELNGIDWPIIWTEARDREVWAKMDG